MSKNNLILLVLVAVLFSACGGEKQPVVTPTQQLLSDAGYTEDDEVFVGMYKRYVGTVAGQPVVLNYVQDYDDIEAEYYYEKIGKGITLYNVADSGKQVMQYFSEGVRDGAGDYAHWEVEINTDSITGTWISSDREKRYPILLAESYAEDIQRFGIVAIEDTIRLIDSLPEPQAEFKYQTLLPIGKDDGSLFVRSVIFNDIMHCDTSSSNKMNACLHEIRQNYITDYKGLSADMLVEDLSASFNNWDHLINLSVQYNENNFVVLNDFIYEYTGGAHGNFNSDYINIDRATKKVLGLSDIIKVDSAELLALLEVQARLHFGLNEKQGLNSRMFYSELHIPRNFYIGNKGITFAYGLYEIASYADGIIELYIPYNKLSNRLTPYFKRRMNLESIALKQ